MGNFNKKGVLLINLGTPDDTSPRAVRRYLKEFLLDRRVIDIPWPVRQLLVRGIIAPFRGGRSAHAYRSIWDEEKQDSPLRLHSLNVVRALEENLNQHSHTNTNTRVVLGMRYGQPSIASALRQLEGCSSLTIIPLFPQYASASSGSAIECALRIVSQRGSIPFLRVVRSFYDRTDFIEALCASFEPYLRDDKTFLLLSYHGIPERHIRKSACSFVCDAKTPCPAVEAGNVFCYRAQCYATSRLIVRRLGLGEGRFATCFQSRLGRTRWTQPYMQDVLRDLKARGEKKIVVASPSFVCDCLETLEEIGIRARSSWGDDESFCVVPCLNASPSFVRTLSRVVLEEEGQEQGRGQE